MGIYEWVKSQTGIWGPALLQLYFRNSILINTLVLVYGLLLLLSWLNLSRILDALVEQVVEQARNLLDRSSRNDTPKIVQLSDFQLSWDRAFAASRFPFIARQTAFSFRRSTVDNARELIKDRELIQRCSRHLENDGLEIKKEK
jgi:hypothetical protein